MRIVLMYAVALVAAVVIGLGASAAGGNSQLDCFPSYDQFNTIVCPED